MARHTACAIDDKCDAEWIGEGVAKLWGPLPLESTAKFGAHAPVCSFVVRPVLDADLVAEVMAEVGGDAIPARDETHARLRQRLKQSTSLDNPRIVVCKRGRHGYFKHQNDIQAREGAQSRRATYGGPCSPRSTMKLAELWFACVGTCICTATVKICGCAGPCRQASAPCGTHCTRRCGDIFHGPCAALLVCLDLAVTEATHFVHR